MGTGYQQGDVLLKKRDDLPLSVKAVPPKSRGYVLAEGEHTGHAHCVTDTAVVDLYEDAAGTLWLKVKSAADLTHEEHHTQHVEPGVYEVGRVVEVDPFTEEIDSVRD